MDDMSVAPTSAARPPTAASRGATGPRDLRDWMTRIEAIGQLKRITAQVTRDEEMGAITYMAHQTIDAPALLFENI